MEAPKGGPYRPARAGTAQLEATDQWTTENRRTVTTCIPRILESRLERL